MTTDQVKHIPEIKSYVEAILNMKNEDLPSDRRWKEGVEATRNTGLLLIDQTLKEDGYALIQKYMDSDAGINQWATETNPDTVTGCLLIALTATPQGLRCCTHHITGTIVADDDAIKVLTRLGTNAPGVDAVREQAMSPAAIGVYGIIGTSSYVDVFCENNSFFSNVNPEICDALVTSFRNATIVVSLSTVFDEMDVRLLGLTNYALKDNKLVRVIPQEETNETSIPNS